jgi:hypothetical protein
VQHAAVFIDLRIGVTLGGKLKVEVTKLILEYRGNVREIRDSSDI